MFTKEDFIIIMTAIEKQHEYDLGYASILSKVVKVDDVPPYDHSNLSNALFSLLQKQFVPIDGQCEIERYCWELNFGNIDGFKVITYDNLWDSLVSKVSLNTDSYAVGLEFNEPEVISSEIASRFFPIDDKKELGVELTQKNLSSITTPKHKVFNPVNVGDYIGNQAHYFFKEEHGLSCYTSIKSSDGRKEIDGRVISVINALKVIVEHKKRVIFEGPVGVITDFSLNSDGFQEEKK